MAYRGEMTVAVPRPDDAVTRFEAQVKQWGGYVVRRQDAAVTCRIPAAGFEAALQALRAYGRVLAERLEAQDVTEEHRDLGIRLDNARRARDRLLVLLEKATVVDDLLKIEKELRRLTEEIETMEAQLQALEDRVAMATLVASFRAAPASASSARSRFAWINDVGVEQVLHGF